MDDVLHESEDVAVAGHLREDRKHPSADELKSGNDDRADNQNKQTTALERIRKDPGEPLEKAFGSFPAGNLDPHQFSSALTAELMLLLTDSPSGDAEVAE